MNRINAGITDKPLEELKFSDIHKGKHPYRETIGAVETRADLLEEIVKQFEDEIKYKVFFSVIDNKKFFDLKKQNEILKKQLTHPYLAAVYHILAQIEKYQSAPARSKNNKSKTFIILDEQNIFQEKVEALIKNPIHKANFTQIIDTAYFGKSHYSKLIQIADLLAGVTRYFFWRKHTNKTNDYWFSRMQSVLQLVKVYFIISNE